MLSYHLQGPGFSLQHWERGKWERGREGDKEGRRKKVREGRGKNERGEAGTDKDES